MPVSLYLMLYVPTLFYECMLVSVFYYIAGLIERGASGLLE
ncbi:hypothetical protein [Caldivirga sp.]